MKLIWKYLIIIVTSLLLSIILTGINMSSMRQTNWSSNGSWKFSLAIGSDLADLYTRAAVAKAGLFALNHQEVIYYISQDDNEGATLNSKCKYRIEGKDIPARWWSITAYGDDHFLIDNKYNRYSYNYLNLAREDDNSYIIHLSPNETEGNWIPLQKNSTFSIILRLYLPAKEVYENTDTIQLPQIIKEDCDEKMG